ncbi:MAG: MarR family transcriptional regulator, partial [Candidatus Firestonebacteria bacterium]
RDIRNHMRNFAQPKLTILQLRILSRASYTNFTNKELAVWAGISKATMSRAIKTMTKKGWLTRKTCVKDKREAYIILTASGKAQYKSIEASVREIVSDKIKSINREKQAELLRGLNILKEVFNK